MDLIAIVVIALVVSLNAENIELPCPGENEAPALCTERFKRGKCFCASRNKTNNIRCWKYFNGTRYFNLYDTRTGVAFCPDSIDLWKEHQDCIDPKNKDEKSLGEIGNETLPCSSLQKNHCVAHKGNVRCMCEWTNKTLTLKSSSYDDHIYMYSWRTGNFLCSEHELVNDDAEETNDEAKKDSCFEFFKRYYIIFGQLMATLIASLFNILTCILALKFGFESEEVDDEGYNLVPINAQVGARANKDNRDSKEYAEVTI